MSHALRGWTMRNALLFTGHEIESREIYTRFKGTLLPDGRRWDDKLRADFTLFRWLGFTNSAMEDVERAVGVQPLDLSRIHGFCDHDLPHSRRLADRLVGQWRCSEVRNGEMYIIDLNVSEDGWPHCRVFRPDGTTVMRSPLEWRVGTRDEQLLLGEFNPKNGTIRLATIKFLENDEYLLVSNIDTTSADNREVKRLYHRRMESATAGRAGGMRKAP